VDLAIRIVGGVVAVYAGLITALLEIVYTPLHAGGWPVPISIPVAVALNAVLVWFGYRATDHKGVALLPGLIWFAVVVIASLRTTEGDLLLTSGWVQLGTIFGGTLAWGAAAYRLLVPRLLG
jgi:hypothetical protein